MANDEVRDYANRSFLGHWMLHLQPPLTLTARFDRAAKQLVAIGGSIYATQVAADAFGDLKMRQRGLEPFSYCQSTLSGR